MKKRLLSMALVLCVLCATLFMGCSKKEEDTDVVYYLSSDGHSIIPVEYEIQSEDPGHAMSELMNQLQQIPDDVELKQTIPSNLGYSVSIGEYHVEIDFTEGYKDLTANEEILIRAAIVKTLLQNKDYYYVMFYVNGEPLRDESDTVVGSMSADYFVENPGRLVNSSTSTKLTLYFSNSDGTALVPEERTVTHSTGVPMEKVIMQQLIEGAKGAGHLSTIAPATKIFNIAISDGICYVNLDASFTNQNMEISESIVLYSIVDSLTQLRTVDKVLISINGDSSGNVRFELPLSTAYEKDMSYLEKNDEPADDTENNTEPAEDDEPATEVNDGNIPDGINGNGFW